MRGRSHAFALGVTAAPPAPLLSTGRLVAAVVALALGGFAIGTT
jgi:MFS transporter, DHA1 family, inner membrane transport protein